MPRIRSIAAAGAAATALALTFLPAAGAAADESSQSQIQRGFEINPVPLDLNGKNRGLVGLGSYIVNTTGCNDCHTNPSYAPGGNPFLGQPEQVNVAGFLAGGQHFGPFVSANITPDALGRPAGLTLEQFISTLRTGHNPLDPPGTLLQVMPWPAFGKKTDRDLTAIYEYLRSIPSIETAN
ncbi:MAG TPA: cytochrome C [Casimicrobiaceae bacterium]|nr:cytochrome C [Casimicrobiaceae bacterium]